MKSSKDQMEAVYTHLQAIHDGKLYAQLDESFPHART